VKRGQEVGRPVAEVLALAAAVLPALVMVGRAIAAGWVPLFDAAYFTVRARDVATEHHPLVGAWSMGSREVGVWLNNLGPLQLDLLAPFTKLDPYWGTALGVGLTNVAAIAGVWLVARRLLGAAGVCGAMAATVLLQLNEGSLMLIEARQQLALVLPMWCVLWLAAAAWHGERWAWPWLVFAASFALQTHFTYAYQAAAVAVAATVALVVRHRGRWRALTRVAVIGTVVAVACWAQPLWDQFAGTGNLSRVVGESGGSARSVGVERGWRILAEAAFVPPFFLPGSMGDLLRSGASPSLATSIVTLSLWLTALVAVAVVASRAPRPSALGSLAAIGVVALLASCFAVVKIPPTEQFGIIAQNYYWAWPVAVFAATALLGWVVRSLVIAPGGAGTASQRWLGAGLATAAISGAAALLVPANRLPETDHEWDVSRHLARPLMDDFGAALDSQLAAGRLDAPLLIDLGGVRHVRYTLLAELQARDIDFRFAAGSTDLSRFGSGRCDDGSATSQLILRDGPGATRLGNAATLLAAVPGVTPEQAARRDALAATFGEALRAGTVAIDEAALAKSGGSLPALLDEVRSTPALPAHGLAAFLDNLAAFDIVAVPGGLRDDLAEWHALEVAADRDRMAIHLQPIAAGRPDLCAAVDPGDDFVAAAARTGRWRAPAIVS